MSHETTNELAIYAIFCETATIFYRQEVAFLFSVQEKLKSCRNSNKTCEVAVRFQMTVI